MKGLFEEILQHPWRRALLGFVFGLTLVGTATQLWIVNTFDYHNMRRGILALLEGSNPWAEATRLSDFYNPPFALFFLWPLLIMGPKGFLSLGAALLAAYAFYRRAWVALGWFGTATLVWLIAAGGVNMYLMGMGLWLLALGDRLSAKSWWRTLLFVLGYGFLLVKPQGGLFIVLLHIYLRRDWRAVILSALIYGLAFAAYYPDWLHVLRTDPPPGQNIEKHSLAGYFGLPLAGIVAILVTCSRPWAYWVLGGAWAGILSPYALPGVPIFLVLMGARSRKALLAYLLYAAGMAWLTWPREVPPQVEYYSYVDAFLRIFHLGMLGYALTLAILSPAPTTETDAIHCRLLWKQRPGRLRTDLQQTRLR